MDDLRGTYAPRDPSRLDISEPDDAVVYTLHPRDGDLHAAAAILAFAARRTAGFAWHKDAFGLLVVGSKDGALADIGVCL